METPIPDYFSMDPGNQGTFNENPPKTVDRTAACIVH